MTKKSLLVLALAVIVAGGVFAQAEDFEDFGDFEQTEIDQTGQVTQKTPMNTIIVDFGPTVIGAAVGVAGKMLLDDNGPSASGFGIAAHYERQILQKLSLGVRFAYLGAGLGYTGSYPTNVGGFDVDVNASLEMKLYSYSIEGHARYYPGGKTFFLDGMLGYANLTAKFDGEVIGEAFGQKYPVPVGFSASRHFLKMGVKIGWRIDFGKPGGFTFEPAFGYYYGIGSSNTLGKQLQKEIKEIDENIDIADMSKIDDAFKLIENFVFVGGPRFTLSFGWRF